MKLATLFGVSAMLLIYQARAENVPVKCEVQIDEIKNGVSQNLAFNPNKELVLVRNNLPSDYSEVLSEPKSGITIGVRATAPTSRSKDFHGLSIKVQFKTTGDVMFASGESGASFDLITKNLLISVGCRNK